MAAAVTPPGAEGRGEREGGQNPARPLLSGVWMPVGPAASSRLPKLHRDDCGCCCCAGRARDNMGGVCVKRLENVVD